ncbi:MAG: hypothetical protein M3Y91_03315 [Actinomycetota bacterium]|nr:hypothetical protein [Actinomycetota bacterium]
MEATSGSLLYLLAIVVAIGLVIGAVCLVATVVYRVKHRDDPEAGT